MKEYIVTKDILNIRSSATDVDDSNFIGQLSAGDTVYLTDDEIVGVVPKGGVSSIWKADAYNRLMSLDGLRLKNYADKKAEFIADPFNKFFIDPINPGDESKWKVSWGIVDLEVWKIWKDYNNKGAGIKVAILDSGLNYELADFKNKNNIIYYNADLDSDLKTDCFDASGHGTECAGILCAQGVTSFGIASDVTLIVIRITDSTGTRTTNAILKGLEKAIELMADIVSLSFYFPDDDPNFDNIHLKIQEANTKNITVCAAVGDSGGLHFAVNNYPASFHECLSIGAITQNETRSSGSAQSDFLDLMAPGDNLYSIINPANILVGSSYSTPFAVGIIALLKSIAKNKNITVQSALMFDFLKKGANQDIQNYNTIEYGWGIIYPSVSLNLLLT